MKPYVLRKMMLVIATFAFLLGGTWMFHATALRAEGAKATKPKAQPMVLVYDTTKSAGTTISLPIIGRAGERIGKANVTGSNDTFTLSNHGLKNGQEIWLSGTSDINTTKPYRVTNAQKNTFLLIQMSTGEKGTGFNPGEEDYAYADGTVVLHKTILPDVTIQWGDGKTSRVTASGLATHTYAKKGKYTVTITGKLPQLGWGVLQNDQDFFCSEKDTQHTFPGIEKLVAAQSFGSLDTHSLSGAFAGAVSLTAVPEALPATVTDISFMFNGAKTFNDNIARWNTTNVTNMSAMFCEATAFNQPLAQWNVSNVTKMVGMFYKAKAFNQSLGQWNVSQVRNMRLMFFGAITFNQPLEKWNVSNVSNMEGMFFKAEAFNQPLEKWNVSQVRDMSAMFARTIAFNQPLEKWNISQVTDMYIMFNGATTFNQPLEKWNVSQVTDMESMFGETPVFNQPLAQWNVSNVRGMSSMFSFAKSFNQPLEKWNVSNVKYMDRMFKGATSFDQDLSRWCVQAIKEEPADFSLDASNWKKAKPQWGTCP